MKARLMLTGILMILTGAIINAQKTSFGLRGGVNFYNITGKMPNGDKIDNKIRTGFNVGVNAEIPIGIDFYIQPGVIYSAKGANDIGGLGYNTSIGYIEIPVNLLYKPDLGTGKLLLGFGPYVAFGVTGNNIYGNSQGDKKIPIKFKSKVTTSDLSPGHVYLKGVDAGANFLFGYEWSNRFSVQLNAGLGLININTEIEGVNSGKASPKNTGFGVSVGYRFAK